VDLEAIACVHSLQYSTVYDDRPALSRFNTILKREFLYRASPLGLNLIAVLTCDKNISLNNNIVVLLLTYRAHVRWNIDYLTLPAVLWRSSTCRRF